RPLDELLNDLIWADPDPPEFPPRPDQCVVKAGTTSEVTMSAAVAGLVMPFVFMKTLDGRDSVPVIVRLVTPVMGPAMVRLVGDPSMPVIVRFVTPVMAPAMVRPVGDPSMPVMVRFVTPVMGPAMVRPTGVEMVPLMVRLETPEMGPAIVRPVGVA